MTVPLADLVAKPKEKKTREPVTVKTNMMRSIYVSPFDPSTEASHIMSHLESNADLTHIISGIVCNKLARKNRKISFVSFKLDVPRHHFDIIVDPKIWQMNGKDELTVKEFVDKTNSSTNPFSPLQNPQKSQSKHRSAKKNIEKGANCQQNNPLGENE